LASPKSVLGRGASGLIPEVNDRYLRSPVPEFPVPTLVDFGADWCVLCRAMEPALAELARDRSDTLRILRLDADKNPETVTRYGVMGLPALILFQSRKVIGRTSQARTRRDVTRLMDRRHDRAEARRRGVCSSAGIASRWPGGEPASRPSSTRTLAVLSSYRRVFRLSREGIQLGGPEALRDVADGVLGLALPWT